MAIHRNCEGMKRRDCLKLGLGALLGGGFVNALRVRASAGEPSAPKTSCILIWMDGGPSHFETFDPKPDAPAEIRGEFQPIRTKVPGVLFSENMKRLAAINDKLAIVRSMRHDQNNHGAGNHYMMTGAPTRIPVSCGAFVSFHPSLGSVVSAERGARDGLPAYFSMPDMTRSGGPNFLGARHAPFVVSDDPNQESFRVRDVTIPKSLDDGRAISPLAVHDERRHGDDRTEALPPAGRYLIDQGTDRAARGLHRGSAGQLLEGREEAHVDRHRRSSLPASLPTGYGRDTSMAAVLLLSDRSPAQALPALDEVRPDLKHEPLALSSLDHGLDLQPSLLLVDAGENPGQAWAVLTALRGRDAQVPAIVIVERQDLERYPWHEVADEFVYPGAPVGELRTRLAMLRRRSGTGEGSLVRLGPLHIDTETYQVTAGGRPLDLTFKEFELLRFLALHPGRVYTRPALLREVWGYDFYGGTRTVDVHVRRLRAKLGPEHEHLIETVRSVGYRARGEA